MNLFTSPTRASQRRNRPQVAVSEHTTTAPDGSDIPYLVKRSRRRRKTLEVSVVGGQVRVAAPWSMRASAVREAVERRISWIVDHLAQHETMPEIRFISGETLPWLDGAVDLYVTEGPGRRVDVDLEASVLCIRAPVALNDDDSRRERIRKAVVGWYRDRALEHITPMVENRLADLACAEMPRVLIRDQKRRWGSCSADGTLRFNWRLLMTPSPLIDYVVVHELAHLTQQNHSPAFWELVTDVIPDARERQRALNKLAQTLPL